MTDIKHSQNQLNEKFFKDMDTVLTERLRNKLQRDEQIHALAESCGIADQAILEELVDSGVCPETISAFRMVPLLMIAWSDGTVQPEEREAILKAAAENGIKPESPAHGLLDSWLSRKPPEDLVEAWKDYTKYLVQSLSPTAVDSLKQEVVGNAEKIATSAGGFLGLGSISSRERAAMDEILAVFP